MACGPGWPSTIQRRQQPPERFYSDAAGKVAVLAKTCRNATIGFIVLGYAIYWAGKRPGCRREKQDRISVAQFRKFIPGFLLIRCSPRWVFTKPQLAAVGNLSRWAFLLTFAGVGLPPPT